MWTHHAVQLAIMRLAPRGWGALFLQHGLNLEAADLETELTRALVDGSGKSTIDRKQPGFEDFCTAGRAGIEAGNPALSLLYHGFASPDVYPGPIAGRTDDDFPTLAELDAIENYIFALSKKKLSQFKSAVVAVFAYQYRVATRTPHRRHADMAYARTGIARVGTAPFHYDPLRRSFWITQRNKPGVSVMPARYAAFIAERRQLTDAEAVMHPLKRRIAGDSDRTFLVPVHKLFAGDECLIGETIPPLSFHEYHRSEKLRKIHQLSPQRGGIPALPGFDVNAPPFLRESKDLVALHPVGASTLLIPNPKPALAATATQHNSTSGKVETVRFRVPIENDSLLGRGNRFDTSSLQIPAGNDGRAAPEYAHIRLHVRPNGQLFDLNTLSSDDFFSVLETAEFHGVAGVEDGPLEAAHIVDNTCDGVVTVHAPLSKPLPTYPAVSLVAAPDFLPLVDQMEVQRWAERNGLAGDNVYFTQGAPSPLCYGRDVLPNPALVDPITHTGPAFDRNDAANRTCAAVMSPAAKSDGDEVALRVSVSTSWLPDAAANVFEPGWDTAIFGDQKGPFYVNYGLGSPFPEDAKLCAALNSFWPAAAPDVGRTFGQLTALPLLDDELGLHPRHPRVLAGAAASVPGWDGQFGPFFIENGKRVSYTSIERSDYTVNALEGKLNLGLLGRIDAVEQLARMDALRECGDRILPKDGTMADLPLLVTAEKVANWAQRKDRFDKTLTGAGYRYVFAAVGKESENPADPTRILATVKNIYEVQITDTKVGMRKNKSAPKVTPRKHP